jgi:pimeloyl-ACP methyl ester carboxylesterase
LVAAAVAITACGGSGRPAAAGHAPTSTVDPFVTQRPSSTAGTTTVLPTTTAPVTAAPTTTPAPAGPPYPVRVVTLPLVDRSRPTVSNGHLISSVRALTTIVWIPEAPGRRPLVVFAHGFQVGPAPYESLFEAWAAHGYIVAAPELPLTDAAIAGANLDEADINNEPADLRFVTDTLVAAGSPVAEAIDPDRVAIAGHSDGAEVALITSEEATPAGQPAYRAVIAMSVQPVPAGATVNPPILITQGDADTINPLSYGTSTWQGAAWPKYFLLLRGGGHLPPVEAGSAWLPGIEAVTEAFLDVYVARDRSPSAIAAAATTSPAVSLQSG